MTAPFTSPMRVGILVVLGLAGVPASVTAQRLDISINPTTISFPASDPDTVPIVSSPSVQITYRVRQNNNEPWTLTLLAMGDLISGLSTVDISNVTWIATPTPFQNGTMSKTVAQRLASGTGNVNPSQQAQITFRLANSWNYNAGLYAQTIIFTLTAP